MTVLEKGNITIHTENIFPIIKKSLYTDHEIFLRELISNAVDAISKLKMASLAGELSGDVPEPEITITDDTVAQAKEAGAIVRYEPLPGKGNVVRRMFADIDADIYIAE